MHKDTHAYGRSRICVISIFRAVLNNNQTLQETDFPTYAGIAITLAAFETNLSIICASLPVMQPMMKLLPQMMKSVFSRSSADHSSDRRAIWSSKDQRRPRFGGNHMVDANFNRLDEHSYPLSSTLVSFEGDKTSAEHPSRAIAVKREWEVSSA